MIDAKLLISKREEYSKLRLQELKSRLGDLPEVSGFPDLTIFGAGSYARLEASEYSDIDMFFLTQSSAEEIPDLRSNTLRLFGKIIDAICTMKFPKFSNDCEYLVVLKTKDILDNIGSRTDDHANYFTVRMLLLLESHCLYGDSIFRQVTTEIVRKYFVDYPDHQQTFQPMFLMNDICRFWKTLLLNYENKKSTPRGNSDAQTRATKRKVRNFKLKYSRMTTCFASIAALGSYLAPVTEEHVVAMTQLTPRERLLSIPSRLSEVKSEVDEVLERYTWFLEMTGLTTADLEAQFADKQQRTEMFRQANEYGDAMFRLLNKIDATDNRLRLVRNLVI